MIIDYIIYNLYLLRTPWSLNSFHNTTCSVVLFEQLTEAVAGTKIPKIRSTLNVSQSVISGVSGHVVMYSAVIDNEMRLFTVL